MFEGHWLDIGRPEDHAAASEVFEAHHDAFLPAKTPKQEPDAE